MDAQNLESLRQALSVSPDNPPLLRLFANACVTAEAYEEVLETFQRLLAVEPHAVDAKLGVATAQFHLGKVSEAILRVEALLQSDADHAPAWALLSRMQLKEGERAQAKASYERAMRLDGSLTDAELETELYMGQSPNKARPAATDGAHAQGPFLQKTRPEEESPWAEDADDEPQSFDFGEMDAPKISFNDVGGMDEVKEEIRMKILYPLQNPDLFRAYGKKAGGGVLIYGPPGCGKTLISRATAGEIHAKFISVGIHEILDLWMGSSEKNIHQLFERARENAPAVLFFDEVDALAADRKNLTQSAGRTLINQFLAEMDGVQSENDGVLIMGATNAPWHIDPAFRRPGRFDRILFVPPPDEPARASIVDILARDKPIKDLNAAQIAKATKSFSGADLKAVFDTTIERSLAEAMKANRIVPITSKELLKTVKGVKPTTKAWFETARNYALYSNQNGIYDDILAYLGVSK